jgi:uncharacterized protein (TIGR03437 family)
MEIRAYSLFGLAVAFSLAAFGQSPLLQIKSFSVGPDQAPSYPNSQIPGLPDEHTTFIPPASPSGPYLVFGASNTGAGTTGGAVALETIDFINFSLAASLGYSTQVMTPPSAIDKCNPAYQTEFDGNYAAPGSVVQDPTQPPGNLIMIYEAENHCPGGVVNVGFYATAGFARSSDNGKTWPAPINGVLGGPARHPVLQSSDPQPSTPHNYEGDAIPSAFVDKDADGNYYLYVTYGHHPASGTDDGLVRVARAKLGADPLNFEKWFNGSFSQPGIGGFDTGVTLSAGCANGSQVHSEISYNDDIGLYLLIFVCTDGPAGSRVSAWYYSTATSLDLEDWTTPQMIQNSQFPNTTPCPGLTAGEQFDGWYPSTVSPGAGAGHTKLAGYFFFLDGCNTGPRKFMSRTFTIVTEPRVPGISEVVNSESGIPVIAPNTWVLIEGSDLAPARDGRAWQGSDFVNNRLPIQLDGVSATVNGKNAYVYYISPTLVSILTPPDAISGSVAVQIINNGATAPAFSVKAQSLSPAFFVFPGGYAAAVHLDGTLIGPATLYPGYSTPAMPNEKVELYANGFGPTVPPVVSGAIAQSGALSPLPVVKIGGLTAQVLFAGLIEAGLYQFNVVVPPSAPDGDLLVTATYNGSTTQAGTLITIQH